MKLTRRQLFTSTAAAAVAPAASVETAARSLRITGVETFPVKAPPGRRPGGSWVFLKLLTSSPGLSGYGEPYMLGVSFRQPAVETMIKDLVENLVVGHNPYHIEALFLKLYDNNYSHFTDFTKMSLISAIEMACWDIVGKDLGKPVYDLLGGPVRGKIRTYTYTNNKPPEYWLEKGFTAVKLDPLGGRQTLGEFQQFVPYQPALSAFDEAEAAIRDIRKAVGDKLDICIGTHGQMTASAAIRLAKRLEQYNPLWFEEPVPPENISEMAQVARGTSIPICTGERLTTKYDFARLIEHHAASIFNLDLGRVGGILEAKKIAGMAEASYLHISPHCWGGPFIAAADIQIDTCSANFLIQESMEQFQGFHADLLKEPIEWKSGYIIPPTRPGLGYELDEAAARKYRPN